MHGPPQQEPGAEGHHAGGGIGFERRKGYKLPRLPDPARLPVIMAPVKGLYHRIKHVTDAAAEFGEEADRRLLRDRKLPPLGRMAACHELADGTSQGIKNHRETLAAAERYLKSGYIIIGIWSGFSVMLLILVVYIAYRMFRVLLEYYQLRANVKKVLTNSLFDSADDEEVYASYDKVEKVPGGNQILNRVRRYSMSDARLKDLRESLNPDKDHYLKPEKKDDEDED